MNYKTVLFFFCLLGLFAFTFADDITQYTVSASVPLNQKVTATGLYDSNATKDGIKCSFYFLNPNNNNSLVYRATDQYTVASGRFTMTGTTLTEPVFVRGETYTLHTECGGAAADSNFIVGQKQEAFTFLGYSFYPQGGVLDFIYIRDNSLMLFGLFIMAMIFIGILVLGISKFF
jgi:hypothetical protein